MKIHRNEVSRAKEETKRGLKSIIWASYLYGVMVVLYGRILPLLLVLCSNLWFAQNKLSPDLQKETIVAKIAARE